MRKLDTDALTTRTLPNFSVIISSISLLIYLFEVNFDYSFDHFQIIVDICTPKAVEYMIEGAEKDINTFYKTSAANDQVNKALWKGVSPPDPNKSVLPSDQAYATSTLFQTAKCTQRAATNFFRNRRNLITRLMRVSFVIPNELSFLKSLTPLIEFH